VAREIIFTPEAMLDVSNAFWWYEEQRIGLGDELLDCLDDAYVRITQNPEHHPIRFDSFRRILIHKFPHAVYFEHDENRVLVYCVFHCSLNPDKLTRRLAGGVR
jgi:plasmid stabilization system protein ParE